MKELQSLMEKYYRACPGWQSSPEERTDLLLKLGMTRNHFIESLRSQGKGDLCLRQAGKKLCQLSFEGYREIKIPPEK